MLLYYCFCCELLRLTYSWRNLTQSYRIHITSGKYHDKLCTDTLILDCGWWYQRLVRHRFINAVKEMYTPGNFLTTVEGGLGRAGTRDNRNSMDPLLLGNDSAIWSEDGVPVFEPQQLGLGSHSQIRILSPEPLASATSIQTPSFRVSRVSYDGGEDSQLLGFDQITNQRRPRPRANS
jgi:hypothetical protein